MADKKKKRPTKRPPKNEFEEILQLKLQKVPNINKDDISDFQIDFGLYNKALEKEIEQTKKNKNQGKKRCVKRKQRRKSARKYSSILKSIKKSLTLKDINSQSNSLEERKQRTITQKS